MRYQFNSYSVPGASLAELFETAQRYGYDGIELRLDSGHGHGVETGLEAADRTSVRDQISRSGLRIDCLCSSVRLAHPHAVDANLADCRASVDLAGDLGVRYVRVFGGLLPDDVSRAQARETLVSSLRAMAEYAEPRGVSVLVETHDDWATPTHLVEVMTRVDHPNAGVLWDVWHTGRAGQSTITQAYDLLSPWVRHVQIHDGLLRQDKLVFRPIGEGEVDHLELLLCLRAGGYTGAVGGEWINWEPPQVHLPRELARMVAYEELVDRIG